MKEDGNFPEYFREIPCNQHPDSSHVGICPHCLKDRLVRLVCSECGNRRISSCSCSDIIDVGSVGRISFLIDTEKRKKLIFFGRSNSSCVGMKKSKGFWRIFRKRKSNGELCDANSEICSFRDNDDFKNISTGLFFDRQMEIDNRVCSVFPIKECDLSGMDESEFFDLKQEIINGGSDDLASLKGKGVYRKGGSCRITMNERGLKQGISRNYNVWRWFFKDDNGGNK